MVVEESYDVHRAPAPAGTRWPVRHPLVQEVLATRQPLQTDEIDSALVPLSSRAAVADVRHSVLVPLILGGEVHGVLVLMRRRDTPFDAGDVATLQLVGNVAVVALRNARFFAELQASREASRRAAQRLRAVVDATLDLAALLDPWEVMRQLLERAAALVEADRATWLRREDETVVLEQGYDPEGLAAPVGYRHPIDAEPDIKQAVVTRQPVLSGPGNLAAVPSRYRKMVAGMRHTAALPLLLAGEVVGLLVLSRRHDPAFDSEDVAMLQLIANVAVLVLRNTRLFAEAQEASRAKGDFLNMAAHELRTPLSVISGYLSMLRDGTLGPPPAAWTRPVDTLAAKTGELGALVEDLLMAARLETASLPLAITRLDLRAVLRDALARAEPRATLLNTMLSQQLPRRPVLVDADPDHLGRILDNLLNNALSYTRGRPWMKVTLSDAQGPEVAVEDHGRGIPAELRERVFERFFRIEDPAVGYQPGTGLGLTISRGLAERHGGSLVLARSRPGKGSTFILRLPPARRKARARR